MTGRPAQQIFIVRLQIAADTDAVRVLRHVLKLIWRRYGIRCLDLREERQ